MSDLPPRKTATLLVGLLLAAAAWKGLLLALHSVPFNSDEAVVALMARHILAGERPIFFYGQSYMGSLDAFLTAGAFAVLGQRVWVIRLVQGLLYLVYLGTTVWLGKECFGTWRRGLLAGMLLAVPTVNVSLYTTASLGGYGEALILANLCLVMGIQLARRPEWKKAFQWGGLAGVGLWANGLTLVASVPAFFYILVSLLKRRKLVGKIFSWVLVGGLIGALPWGMYALQNGLSSLLSELLGSAVAVEQVNWLVRSADHLVGFILLGLPAAFGLRPPWSTTWLALPLLPIALAFWIGSVVYLSRSATRPGVNQAEYALLGGTALMLLAGFVFTSFGVDPSGRYFLPLAAPFSLAAAGLLESLPWKTWVRYGLLGVIVLYQGIGTMQCALSNPPGLTTQFDQTTVIDHAYDNALITFLHEQGETHGYSNYWVSYPLAFLSQEEIIFIPRLPYHQDLRYTRRDDRYLPYDRLVEGAQRSAYVTTRNPALDEKLQEGFTRLEITWLEKQIGDYHIYYQLSRLVRPEELGVEISQ